ncbi:dihydropteroate synthase [Segnochrobactrum spirostomi]|uniref:Dihydropteroate synthase n=1 Tax=Segnochrobactrum spirostomi TaxID=2608987 RepID=A0A6A7Y023_9HYPH|nr:dihydropteroate synthase [Segnochrobactrum spirostomi]MQT11511.1 dihydropteroate synthase [Segnochrobactrum spirostomi]
MPTTLDLGRATHVLGSRTLLMGILNVTPDSFSDGGRHNALDAALDRAVLMVEEGADLVDVGGESTRPGSTEIDAETELSRVLPVLERLGERIAVPVSIDTYKAAVADRALQAGAHIINDVWGLQRDPDMAAVAAAHGAPVIVMHNRREVDPALDIVDEVRSFFLRSLVIAEKAGIREDRIVLDPGIGFGKTLPQNVELIARLDAVRAMGLPVLLGASRKSLIGGLTGIAVGDRLPGTIATHMLGVARGADILRVHDVAAHVQAVKVTDAIVRAAKPAGWRGEG